VDHVSDFYAKELYKIGYSLVYYDRKGAFRSEGIAIAYKTEKFNLLATEKIDLDDVSKEYPDGGTFRRVNQAMLCLFELRSG